MGLASADTAAHVPLPGFLNSLAGPLDHYGYWAVALLLLLENIGVPVIPGELALIVGAVFAATGRAGLNIIVVAVVAVIAAFVGAEIGYLIGRFGGRELILRYGRYVYLKPHHLDRAQAVVDRYGGPVVIIARFIVGLREANGIICGITQMRWLFFAVSNAIGACAWVATWVSIGYVAGDHIGQVYADVNRFSVDLLIVFAVLVIGYVGWRLLRRRRASKPAAAVSGAEEGPVTSRELVLGEGYVAEEIHEMKERVDTSERLETRQRMETSEGGATKESRELWENTAAGQNGEAGENQEARTDAEAWGSRPTGGNREAGGRARENREPPERLAARTDADQRMEARPEAGEGAEATKDLGPHTS
jgi:membrane protein DedA with SNARE-associated domain